MRILIFNWRDIKAPNAGGAELVVHENAKRWAQAGHEVTLFCRAFPGCKKQEKVERVKIVRAGNGVTVYWQAFWHYRRHFQGKYDVVLDAINTIPFFIPFYVKESKIALIFQITGKIYFRELPKLVAIFPYLLEPILFKIYKKVPVLVLSESIRQELVNIGFSSANITVIPPGIEHNSLEAGEKTTFPSVLYFNRLVKYKNADHLINAVYIIKREIPEIKLFIAGCRGGKYEAHLKRLVRKLNLEKEVEFYPFLGGEAKEKLLQSAWVHVLPSLKEGWGISVLEAGACETPTIGYVVDGLRDAVKDGETGLLVPYGDIERLAEAIKKVLQDVNLRKRLSQNSMAYAKTFRWDKSARRAEEVMEELLS